VPEAKRAGDVGYHAQQSIAAINLDEQLLPQKLRLPVDTSIGNFSFQTQDVGKQC